MKKYINSVSAFQFYQLARYSTLILTGIIFAKTAISQSAIGEYETFVFIAGAVTFFWLNGLQKALLPLASDSKNTKQAVFSSFVTLQLLSILAALFLLLLNPAVSGLLLNGKEIPEPGLLIVYIIFGTPANMVEYYYLIRKKNNAIIIYSLLSFSVQFALVTLPVVFGLGIETAMKGLTFSGILRYAWILFVFVKNNEIHYSHSFVKKYLKLGGPLVTATLLSGSAQYIDGFIVTSFFDDEKFAVFRYGARELPLAMLLANALSNAMLPDFAKKENLVHNLAQLKKNVTRLMHLLFPLTATLLVLSHPVFPVIFNPNFAESATIFNIYLLLIISRLLLPQTLLNGMQISKPLMDAAFFELVVNVSLSLLLVRFYGISGVAFATFVAYLFEKIYLSVVVKKRLNINLSDYVPVKVYLMYSVGILIVFVLAEYVF